MLDPATLPTSSATLNGCHIRCLLFDLGDTPLPATQFSTEGYLPLSALIAYNATFEHALNQHTSYLQPSLVISCLGDLLHTFKGVTTS